MPSPMSMNLLCLGILTNCNIVIIGDMPLKSLIRVDCPGWPCRSKPADRVFTDLFF